MEVATLYGSRRPTSEQKRARDRRYYAANRDEVLAKRKAHAADPDEQERKRAYRRAFYLANRERLLAQAKARYDADPESKKRRDAERRQELRRFIRAQKEGKSCAECGFADPRALDFHHRDSTLKEFDLSVAWQKGWSKKRIAAEIAKCDIICANCHRILHAGERDEL